MNLLIDSRDLGYTIDTYGMFTGDSVEEGEQEYYADTYGLTEAEWFDFGFDYDHPEIVKALANSSIQLLDENLIQHGSGIVKAIDLRSTTSPRFYNYTTDGYTADWTIDESKLVDWLNTDDNASKFGQFIVDEWHEFINIPSQMTIGTLYNVETDDDKLLIAALDFYCRSEYDPEDYEMSMFEHESEAYIENMKPDAESQKLIDSKETK